MRAAVPHGPVYSFGTVHKYLLCLVLISLCCVQAARATVTCALHLPRASPARRPTSCSPIPHVCLRAHLVTIPWLARACLSSCRPPPAQPPLSAPAVLKASNHTAPPQPLRSLLVPPLLRQAPRPLPVRQPPLPARPLRRKPIVRVVLPHSAHSLDVECLGQTQLRLDWDDMTAAQQTSTEQGLITVMAFVLKLDASQYVLCFDPSLKLSLAVSRFPRQKATRITCGLRSPSRPWLVCASCQVADLVCRAFQLSRIATSTLS